MIEPGHDCWDTCWKIIAGLVGWALLLKAAIVYLYKAEARAKDSRLQDHIEARAIIKGGGRR